jgi:hypothetical protein
MYFISQSHQKYGNLYTTRGTRHALSCHHVVACNLVAVCAGGWCKSSKELSYCWTRGMKPHKFPVYDTVSCVSSDFKLRNTCSFISFRVLGT